MERERFKFKERNSRSLHNHLWDQLEGLENGDLTPQHVRATSSVVSNMIANAKLEMDHARFVSDMRGRRDDGGDLPALKMGG